MQRKQFIRLSAGTAAALMLGRLTVAGQAGGKRMSEPDEIWAQTGNQWMKLESSGSASFSYRDLVVNLRDNAGTKSVFVQSPTLALQGVRLRWKHGFKDGSKFLGDQWERSYGDLAWKTKPEGVKNPWYLVIDDGSNIACFGVKTGCNSICYWQLSDGFLELTMDTLSGGNGVQLGQRSLHTADIITMKGNDGENAFQADQRFCKMMCDKPRLPKQPVYGINDWYFAYGNNSFELIRKTTMMMGELVTDHSNKPFSVIDAGWATYSPLLPGDGGWNDDFSRPNEKFGDMKRMADEIKKAGMRPGLWMRPLCAKHDEKSNLLAPSIPGRDDPKYPTLDPTIPENLARVKRNFDFYKKWGYEMVKHDFSTYDIAGRWGMQMKDSFTAPGWSYHNNSITNAEIMLQLYRAIREAAGDNIYLIGCNTMSHLSAGIFELCRIGDDTSGKEWERTRKFGVNTLAFRLPQHDAFYAADGDCVGLTTDIAWARNKQWLQLLAESGAPLFISAQPEAMGLVQKDAVKLAFSQAAKQQPVGEPLDWMNTQVPARWKLNNREVTFDWS